MNWELERNFVDPNSSIGDKFGVGVPGSTSTHLNLNVEGIILADGSTIHSSNTFEYSNMLFVIWRESWWLVKYVMVGAETLYFLALQW